VSIITNPNTDPHSYEPTAVDARTLATSQLVIENGIGYDPWVPKLLSADQASPTVLDVGTILGSHLGANPHAGTTRATSSESSIRWAGFQSLEPTTRATCPHAHPLRQCDLAPYDAQIAAIRSKYAGTPSVQSESIFAMLAPALGSIW